MIIVSESNVKFMNTSPPLSWIIVWGAIRIKFGKKLVPYEKLMLFIFEATPETVITFQGPPDNVNIIGYPPLRIANIYILHPPPQQSINKLPDTILILHKINNCTMEFSILNIMI